MADRIKGEISIVIPTLNEEGNIKRLVQRIDTALISRDFSYELIFVDDHSTDATRDIINALSRYYPVSLFLKKGKAGKAFSLLEGFKRARYDLVCMIDADLQYPPEAIPEMMDEIIEDRADVVTARRKERNVSLVRKILSRGFVFVFGRLLHGLKVDVQSGLKVFKKEIIECVSVLPSKWTFDLEFLIKAKSAGYRIGETDIIFSARTAGEAKISLIKATFEIGISALKWKFKDPGIIPMHPYFEKNYGKGFHHKGAAFVHHSDLHPHETAYFRLLGVQKLVLVSIAALFLASLFYDWKTTLIITNFVLITGYFANVLFDLFLISRSFSKNPDIKVTKKELLRADETLSPRDWPTYTILCPLYKEWQVIPQFVSAMSNLDYPKKKLQILLLLEEDDFETIRKVKEYDLPEYFEVAIIPHSLPKTKPKALNYGMKIAKGEFVVIYDAEDVPEPEQLKKALIAFARSGDEVVCVQAKLNFYNPHQNTLTRAFAAEYSLWFELVLTGLQSINAPIPLGGTSNHFRLKDIRKLKGWDAFNVTEDCDLGIRLSKQGFKTAIVDSATHEEANSDFKNWIKQRSRWIKGYIQSYLVHMRNVRKTIKEWGLKNFLIFQLVVGGKVLSLFINPFMWVLTIIYFSNRAFFAPIVEPLFPPAVLYMGVFSLIFGNFLYLYYYMIGCAKRGYFDIIKYAFVIPFYWLSMSAAAWIALYEMVVKPHYWAKTTHGLHLESEKASSQARNVIGKELVDSDLARPPVKIPINFIKGS